MKTYQIHLIRHATTEGNLAGQYIGHTDMDATEAGLRQIDDLKEEYGGSRRRIFQSAETVSANGKTDLSR